MPTNTIARARVQDVFCVKETTRGTLVFPAAANYVVAAGECVTNQQASFTDSDERKNTRDVTDRFQDRFGAGNWSIPMYLRPSGTAGTAPDGDVLFECLTGVKTIVGGTSVTYSQSTEKSSFSLWHRKDHTIFWARGCTVNNTEPSLATTGGARCDFSGEFMEMGWCGTDSLNGALLITDTAVVVVDAKKYTVGSKVEFEDAADDTIYNNTSAGYEITAIDVATETLTITPGLEHGLDTASIIRGFLPVGTEVGVPLESRKGKAVIAGVDTPVQSMNVTISDPAMMLTDEITTTDYPEDYAEGTRDLSGSFAAYFRENDLKYFYDGQNSNELAVSLVVGDTAGSIVTFAMPQTELEIPSINESDPTVALDINIKALGSAGEDSLTIAFT